MPNISKQNIDDSILNVQNIATSLKQALIESESPINKVKIQHAITALNSACRSLSNYQDY